MARIIAGELKNHFYKAYYHGRYGMIPHRLKTALFNSLGDLSQFEMVLDAYAGSGGLIFEALSRGAKRGTAIEINRHIYKDLYQNTKQLGLDKRVEVYRANNLTCLTTLNESYDLIFLDPDAEQLKKKQLLKIASYLKQPGCLVFSYPAYFKTPFEAPTWQCFYRKQFQHLRLDIYG